MKTLRLAPLVLLVGCASAHAQGCPKYSDEWAKCDTDEDCAIQQSACYFTSAFNKRFLEQVRRYNACVRPMIKCALPPEDDAQKTKAVCQGHKCLAVKP